MMTETTGGVSITVLLPAGRLPLDLMQAVHRLAVEHGFGIYCAMTQNSRRKNLPEAAPEQ
jgi:hypothetical protein